MLYDARTIQQVDGVAVDWPWYLVDDLGVGADGVEVIGLGDQNLLKITEESQE